MSQTHSVSINDLDASLEYALSHAPSQAGLKLKSDRELADELQVNESNIRTALRRLATKGILTRRQGSGTFVRRLGTRTDRPGSLVTISPERLFKELPPTRRIIHPRQNQREQLHLGLWGDLQYASQTSQRIYGAITSQASSDKVRMSLNTVLKQIRTRFSKEELAEQLDQSEVDGVIVLVGWAFLFDPMLKQRRIPVVYISSGNVPTRTGPNVFFNTYDAIERGITLLLDQGYDRVAVLGFSTVDRKFSRPEHALYELAMSRSGKSYRAIGHADQDAGMVAGIAAMRSLLDRPDPPEAVYVADDTLLPSVVAELNDRGMVPGKDIAIMTLSNRGVDLPGDYHWSRLEFNADTMARIAMRMLREQIEQGRGNQESISIHARWVPGDTHTLSG